MGLENLALVDTASLPIVHEGDVHSGKVRGVYWLPHKNGDDVALKFNLPFHPSTQLGVMVTSDRLSAFDVIWQAEEGLAGVPGKGAALNAVSLHWFNLLKQRGIVDHHVLVAPHPLVWIVQRADPVMVEVIARDYITGSMWRAYEGGQRVFNGVTLPDGLKKDEKLPNLLLTPTTKGTMRSIPGVKEEEDAPVTTDTILANWERFGYKSRDDVALADQYLATSFGVISAELARANQLFVDTKFEFGYVRHPTADEWKMVVIDEVGTPDSSRIWGAAEYAAGRTVEKSKEGFRQRLLATLDRDVLLKSARMDERRKLARTHRVSVDDFMDVSRTYKDMARTITGRDLPEIRDARSEILDALTPYGLIK
ncbi:MAG: phosphoribosylaminoimidazolesuccinocarboxamide synthase [Nanoarchaeota archaeon]